MVIRTTFNGRQVGRAYSTKLRAISKRHRQAVDRAVRDIRDEALDRSRSDISSAGNFGSRWTRGLHGTIESGESDINLRFTHDIPYFMVHQTGRLIRGRPMLWIPLSFAEDAQGVRARDFPGGLFRVDRKKGGAPLLLSIKDRQPKYFGKTQVYVPKRFRVIEIIRETARKFKTIVVQRLRETNNG